MTDPHEPDPLAELLVPPTQGAEALRQAVLTATMRRLRQRRWLRRGALVVALAACYAAGLLTMHLRAPAIAVPDAPVPVAERPAPAAAVPTPAPASPSDHRPESAALLRQAGDRYLNDDNDPEAALQCYSKALDAGTEDDVKFSPDDNWLLMAIKNAREKEARHAN